MGRTKGLLILIFGWTAKVALVSLCVGFVGTSVVWLFPGLSNYSFTAYLEFSFFWLTVGSLWLYLVSMFAHDTVEKLWVRYAFAHC